MYFCKQNLNDIWRTVQFNQFLKCKIAGDQCGDSHYCITHCMHNTFNLQLCTCCAHLAPSQHNVHLYALQWCNVEPKEVGHLFLYLSVQTCRDHFEIVLTSFKNNFTMIHCAIHFILTFLITLVINWIIRESILRFLRAGVPLRMLRPDVGSFNPLSPHSTLRFLWKYYMTVELYSAVKKFRCLSVSFFLIWAINQICADKKNNLRMYVHVCPYLYV